MKLKFIDLFLEPLCGGCSKVLLTSGVKALERNWHREWLDETFVLAGY